MSFRHLSPKQNNELAALLLAAAKGLGVATILALFFGGVGVADHPIEWVAAVAATILLGALGILIIGRVERDTATVGRSVPRTRRKP